MTDVYYRADYAEVAAVVEGGEARMLETEDALFPVIVRNAGRDVTNPYGYGGALARDEDAGRRFYAWYGDWCRENGIASSFVRFHPLLRNHVYADPPFELERVAGSVAWRLEGDLFQAMHAHHRRAVRKAQRLGVAVTVTEAPTDLAPFVRLYEQTMDRNEAASFYYFPGQYWRGLEGREWLVLFEGGGAATLCFATPPWLHYQFGASGHEARSTGASHLLMLCAAQWGQERGYEQFHLGAGLRGGGGPLLEWKRRFAPGDLIEQWVGRAQHET